MIRVKAVVEILQVHLEGSGPHRRGNEVNVIANRRITVPLIRVDTGNPRIEFRAVGTGHRDVVGNVKLAEITGADAGFDPRPRIRISSNFGRKLGSQVNAGIITVITATLDITDIAVEVDLVNIVCHWKTILSC